MTKVKPMTKKADRKLEKFIAAVFANDGTHPMLTLGRDGKAKLRRNIDFDALLNDDADVRMIMHDSALHSRR